jgi:hypothetical protein
LNDVNESRAPAGEGVPLWLLAAVGLVASLLGRGVSPALPGSTTGIERFIVITYGVTSILSQLAAAGAVAFVLRLSGMLLVERRLGIAFRTVALPAATAVAALTVAAAHDGLDAEMQSVLAVACLMSVAVSIPFALLSRAARAVGLMLVLAALSSLLHFSSLALAIRAGETASAGAYQFARGVATAGWILDLALLAFTVVWLGAARGTRIAALGVTCVLFGFAMTLLAREGLEPDASAWLVVIARTFDELSRPPLPFIPAAARYVLEAALGLSAILCLADRRRLTLGALFTLALIGRGAADVPLSALLLCAGALSLPLLSLQSEASTPPPAPAAPNGPALASPEP